MLSDTSGRCGDELGAVLTVMNMKGGVGKTTIAIHLAGLAAREALGRGQQSKVLLIDYDPQFNSSQAYLPGNIHLQRESDNRTILSVLMDHPNDVNPFSLQAIGHFPPPKVDDLAVRVLAHGNGYVDIVPSTLDLMYVALGQPNRNTDLIRSRFHDFIRSAKAKYDLVIIDCHPAASIFTQTSLSSSDHVLIPTKPDRFAVRGLGLMNRFIEGRGPQRAAISPHIVFNMVTSDQPTPEEVAIRADRKLGPLCLRNRVRHWKHLTKPSEGSGFVWDQRVAYHKIAMQNLRVVFTEILGKVF